MESRVGWRYVLARRIPRTSTKFGSFSDTGAREDHTLPNKMLSAKCGEEEHVI